MANRDQKTYKNESNILQPSCVAGSTYDNERQPRVLCPIFDWVEVTGRFWPFMVEPIVNLSPATTNEIVLSGSGRARRRDGPGTPPSRGSRDPVSHGDNSAVAYGGRRGMAREQSG